MKITIMPLLLLMILALLTACGDDTVEPLSFSPENAVSDRNAAQKPDDTLQELSTNALKAWQLEKPTTGERYTDDEIKSFYLKNGRIVSEIYDAGDLAVVAYKYKESSDTLRFAWFDRISGERIPITKTYVNVSDVHISKYSVWIRSDNFDTVFIAHGSKGFPKIYNATIIDDGESRYADFIEKGYYMPSEKVFDSGPGYQCTTLSIITYGWYGIRFEFQEHPHMPWISDSPSPPGISVDLTGSTKSVRLYNTFLPEDYVIKNDDAAESSVLSVKQDGNDVVIQFEREKEIQRYTLFSGNDSITYDPYTEVNFIYANSIGAFDHYPEGW